MKVKIKEIADIKVGVHLRATHELSANYFQVSDFDSMGNLIYDIKPTVANLPKDARHILNNDDLLFAAKGNKNFSAIYKNQGVPSFASVSFVVISINDQSVISSEYLNWYLNQVDSIARLQSVAVGSSIISISKQNIEDFEVNIPALQKQELIVQLSKLQEREQEIYALIALKTKQITDYKIKTILEYGN